MKVDITETNADQILNIFNHFQPYPKAHVAEKLSTTKQNWPLSTLI